ncbi:origin recognition complex subunit 1-like isoform X3 [Aphis gossypii]|uniref:origin recognition complex subunit 1-like isoform X3 n=1 Tax=Aphis gossypii TaxID=80765 RepID=UPI00215998CF|nr:origin recognition complex subunit 1-like isoform X3 [Aphis gossypii]
MADATNKCDAYCFSNHINKNEELNEEKKIITDTVNELIDKESNSHANHIDKTEERKEATNIIGDIVNELIDNVIIENDGQSIFEHYMVTEQKLTNGVMANIVNSNSTLNEEPESQILEESVKEHSNSEDREEKVDEKINSGDEIESPRVRKRFGIKNTAILLINKTVKENKLKDQQFKIELNRNKMLNNGNLHRDKDEIFTNKSNSFKKEKEFSLKNEPEKTDCSEEANNSYSKDTAIGSTPKYISDIENLDIHKNKESLENQCEINKNKKWIMKNNVDQLVNNDGNESLKPTAKTEDMITKNNDVHWKNFDDYDNIPITMTENIIATNNDECWDNYNVCENKEPIIKTENMITKSKDEHPINNDDYENRKPITNTEKNMITKNNSELQEKNDNYENKKSIVKTGKMLKTFEIKDDIFSLPSTFSLAHCVTEDFNNAFGMTADFKFKFGHIGALMDLNLRVGDVGHIFHNEQHVFYLVVKRKMSQKSLLCSLEMALCNLRNQMNNLKLTKLAISKYGFESYNMMMDVKSMISKIFASSNIELTICLTSSKLETEHIKQPKVNFTYKHLWEMEKQTDLIIFINMCTMYSENWNDKVVERINAKYPFKERLLKDINIKPMAPGDILSYKIDTEVIFCIFIKPFDQNPSYFRCLEKAFQEMKSQITGYRYLGVQQDPLNHKTNIHNLSRNLIMLKSVFSNRNAEIWVCGDTDQHNSFQYQQYKKTVTDAIDINHKRSPRTSAKSRTKSDRKRHSTNSNTSKHDSTENYYCKTTTDVNSVEHLNQEQTSIDNYITENWDN